MSNVVGAELYILHLKYLKNEREQVSMYEIQPDRALNSLSGIVMKSMQSKFLASSSGFVYNLNYVDTFQYILMDLIKGLRFHGWRLLTSHALSYASNTAEGGLVMETSFFFEIKALDFILMMNSNSITTSEMGTNGISNHRSSISGTIGSFIDGSKYTTYEAKTSSLDSPPRYSNVPDSGATTERDEFGEFNPLSGGNVGASTGVSSRIPPDTEYASILLDKSATSQTGPYGFARIHSMQTGHSPKPRVDPARTRMPAAPPVTNSLAPLRPSEDITNVGDDSGNALGATSHNNNNSTSVTSDNCSASPPHARKSLVFPPRKPLFTSAAPVTTDPASRKSIASPSKPGTEQSSPVPVASTATQAVPVLEKQPSAADKLFQKYSQHRKSVVLSPRKSIFAGDTGPVASLSAPSHATATGDSVASVADASTVKPDIASAETPTAATPSAAPALVPPTSTTTTTTASGTSAANKLFQKYSQHRKPSLYRTPSQGNVLYAGQPATATTSDAAATAESIATGTARETSAAVTTNAVKPLTTSTVYSESPKPVVAVAAGVTTAAPSKSLTSLFATTTTESVGAKPAPINPTASDSVVKAELGTSEGRAAISPATLPDTILVHHSQLAAVVGEQNVRRSIGGFRRVKSNSISGQNLLSLLAAGGQGEVGVVESASADADRGVSVDSNSNNNHKHVHQHRRHGVDDDDDDYGDVSRISKISEHGHEEGEDLTVAVAVHTVPAEEKKTQSAATPVISLTAAPVPGPEPQFSPMPATKPPLGPARNHSLRGSLSLKNRPQPVDMDVDPFSSAGSSGSVSGSHHALGPGGLRAHSSGGGDEDEDYGDLTQIRAIEHGAEVVDAPNSSALVSRPPLDVPKPVVDEVKVEAVTPVAVPVPVPVSVPVATPIAEQSGSFVANPLKEISNGAVLPVVSDSVSAAVEPEVSVSSGSSDDTMVTPVSEETDGSEKPAKKRPSLFLAPNPMDATIKGSSLFVKAAVDNSSPEEKQAEMLHQSSRTQHYSKLGSAFVSENVLSVRGGLGGRGRGAGRGAGIR